MLKTVDMREASARQVEQILAEQVEQVEQARQVEKILTDDDVDAVIVLQPEVIMSLTCSFHNQSLIYKCFLATEAHRDSQKRLLRGEGGDSETSKVKSSFYWPKSCLDVFRSIV